MDFVKFKNAVAKQFAEMAKNPLYRTVATSSGNDLSQRISLDKDALWDTYLNSFPAGTNPMYRERTEYDCNCCRQFVRTVGNVVSIVDGKLVSIWDVDTGDANFQVVADALSAYVKGNPIQNVFLHTERSAGTNKTFEELTEGVKTWDHFFVNIPAGKNGERNFVVSAADIGTKLSEFTSTHDVMLRGLTELDMDSIDTVLELISQNSLYRGEEHKYAVTEFRKLKKEFDAIADADKDAFVWSNVSTVNGAVSRIRNTSIGSLLVDLSAGVDLEDAVKMFETKVAGPNYKRPTALVSKKMVEDAKKKIEAMGLTSALERRYANISDITINNILFADRSAKKAMTGDVFDTIANDGPKTKKKMDRIEEVSIEKFISDILPTASSVEVMVENNQAGNFVSLIAPVDPSAGNMFKWGNNFSWSYNGDMADSIKERVKQAGGNVTGDLCCRLAWFNYDDLDLHMIEPDGYEIYFGNRSTISKCGGQLDVDMNAGSGKTREAVENIFYRSRSTMKEGVYKLFVRNFTKRESIDVGFEVEMDFCGDVYKFAHPNAVRDSSNVTVVEFKYSKTKGIEIIKSLPSTSTFRSTNIWGIETLTFQKVNVIMMSPNYWDEQGVGNKHYFFMLDGCVNDGVARGFYNEFLKQELNAHRKVIEIVGSKMKTEKSNEQLSGVGFSSTQRNSITCRVTGNFVRTIKVVF